MTVPLAKERVLPTLNLDGSRRWIRPKWSHGRYATVRRWVAYVLMVVFIAIPHLTMAGRPMIMLDLPHREFTLFGTTFLPTDTLLLMLLLVSLVITIFLLTALFGRVWCGWACPQTVYMEFLFRPLERWLEGGRSGSLGFDRAPGLHWRRVVKYVIYLGLALLLAHTFLAYFVGVDQLTHWVRSSPAEHPTAFAVMAVTTAAIFLDFSWFREQTCMVACPYGRLQSVLLDRQSLIVAYDVKRGEPRGKGTKNRPASLGDCIDCGACVLTCPTGIDIRDGLQMECIHCTQCADACDDIMRKVGKPTGLIRYSSRDGLEGRGMHFLRPRVVLYPMALALFGGLFVYNLGARAAADITVLRGTGEPFTVEPDGHVANQLRVKIVNRTRATHDYRIALAGAGDSARMIAPQNPVTVEPARTAGTSLFIVMPNDAFVRGERTITLLVTDGAGFTANVHYKLVGPDDSTRDAHPSKEPHP